MLIFIFSAPGTYAQKLPVTIMDIGMERLRREISFDIGTLI
jgi:hypothetical protein